MFNARSTELESEYFRDLSPNYLQKAALTLGEFGPRAVNLQSRHTFGVCYLRYCTFLRHCTSADLWLRVLRATT